MTDKIPSILFILFFIFQSEPSAMASLFVDDLTVIDFSYLDAKRGIVGESWIVDVVLEGELNDEGMVFDFGFVKKKIKAAIDEGFDHKFVVPRQLANVEVDEYHEDGTDKINIIHKQENGEQLVYNSPREAVYLLDTESVDIAQVTPLLEAYLKTVVPDNVKTVSLTLRTEIIEDAFYHYSHGLKKHQGDCQRICHGHRSRIHVFVENERDTELEQYWADMWSDIYLITDEDIMGEFNVEGTDYIHLGYDAEQGRFELTIAAKRCDILNTDTTVELIAEYLAQKTAEIAVNHNVTVKAFEGVGKGAIASAYVKEEIAEETLED
jgi:6-pyruvoyl-tetrahydropterin synthase